MDVDVDIEFFGQIENGGDMCPLSVLAILDIGPAADQVRAGFQCLAQ